MIYAISKQHVSVHICLDLPLCMNTHAWIWRGRAFDSAAPDKILRTFLPLGRKSEFFQLYVRPKIEKAFEAIVVYSNADEV